MPHWHRLLYILSMDDTLHISSNNWIDFTIDVMVYNYWFYAMCNMQPMGFKL